jgi:flagellar hook-length control protein FliK
VENIQLDMAVITTDSTPANIPGQRNYETSDTSNNPFFSKVLAKEQTPEKAPKETTSEKGDSEQTAVADGNALPEEDTDLPQEAEQAQETEKKAEIIPLLVEGELNIPELPDEQATLEVPEQTLLPETIETTEPSPTIIEEDTAETIENLVQPEDNIIPITVPIETKEIEPTLKVGNTSEVVARNIETEVDAIPQSEVPESDAPAETVVALNPQQAVNVKPTIDPESKTSKVGPKTGVIDKLSLVNSNADASSVVDTESLPESLPETTDSDFLLKEPIKPEAPIQSPIARAIVKEFSDIQSNNSQQNTLGNEIGIKLGDIQTNSLRPPVQLVNSVQTSPLPAMNMDRPGWEQSFANNVSWMNSEKVQTANIRISPAELGPIEIKMTVKQDQLTLNINAHHAVTRETLENAMPRLREVLANNGFTSVNVDVSGQQTNGGNAENNASTGSDWFGAREGSEFESEQDGDGLIQPEQRMTATGSGMVDIFA